MTAANVQILGPDQKPVTTVRPDQTVEIRVTLPEGSNLPSSVDVTITTDKDTVVVSVPRQTGAGPGNSTYSTGSIQLGHGVAEGYGLGKGATATVNIGNGAVVHVSTADGGGADVRWYPDDLQQAIGQNELVMQAIEAFLNKVLMGLKDAPATPEVQEVRQVAQQKLDLLKYTKGLLANDEIWPRSKVYLSNTALTYLMRHEALDLREVYPAISTAIDRGKDEGREIVLSGFTDLTIVFYEQFTSATGAAALWTLMFGQNIYGKDVSGKEQLLAAAELGFMAAMTILPILHMREMTVARTSPRIARPTGGLPRPIEGVAPRGAPPGVLTKAEEFGMLPDAAAHVNTVATNNGAIIQVRPTNQSAMRWRELGHPGKPMDIKAKTINELDTHLGARSDDIGLVGYFEPQRPVRQPGMTDRQWSEIQTRYNDRLQEFGDNATKMQHLEHDGKIRIDEHGVVIDTGIAGGTGKGITGDYDLWRITKLDGTPFSAADEELIVNQLRFGAYGAQHGAHTSWKIDPNAPMYVADPDLLKGHLKVDADIRAKHLMGADKAEAVIEFGGLDRPPVTAYEAGATPGSVTAESSGGVVAPPISGARRITGPMKVGAGAVILVLVVGAGWVALRSHGETVVTPPAVDAASAASVPSSVPRAAPVNPSTTPAAVAANVAPVVRQLSAQLNVPTTTYSVVAEDPDGDQLTYAWKMEVAGGASADNNCGTPKVPWTQTGSTVRWSHPGSDPAASTPNPCPHTTTDHPVSLTLTISDGRGGSTVCVVEGSETRTYVVQDACH